MCGILGKITVRGEHESAEQFAYALAQIAHRGPDDHGMDHRPLACGGRLSLGHRRLSILDLSPAGHQPMHSAGKEATIIFNGEVYNFREVRRPLEQKGVKFVSQSDTEAILAAYLDDGEGFVSGLRGIFGLAIWDERRQRLVLARDRLGVKPLYYYWDGSQFAFASEVTALAALPSLRLEVSQHAIRQFLMRGFIAQPLSIYQNVRKLPAGHMLVFEPGQAGPIVRRYWEALDYYAQGSEFRREDEVIEALRSKLSEAVKTELISDVPVGAFLSGGIDSSLVTALMCKAHGGPVQTFSIGFTVPEWNEAPAAKRIAEHLGTEHHEFYLSEENVLEIARGVAEYYDEPFADSSNIPMLALSRLTRRHVTVALSGDGGDELFWGYNAYTSRSMRAYGKIRMMPRAVRRVVAGALKAFRGTACERWGHILSFNGFAEYYMRTTVWHPWLYPDLQRERIRGNRMIEIGEQVMERLGRRDQTMLMGAMDLKSYLVEDILTKVDRASMSVALEARVPILDHRFVELAVRVPSRFKTAGGEKKHLLKRLLGELVPRELWDRPKMGFGVPLVHWLRGPLKEWAYDELLSSGEHGLHDWLEARALRAMLDDHVSGRRNVEELIWACLQLAGWDRRVRRIRAGRAMAAREAAAT